MPRPARTRSALTAAACALCLWVTGAGCGRASAGRPLSVGSATTLPRSPGSHVVVIVLENAEYGDVIGSPSATYTNQLARRFGLSTGSYAITHPSLPNYVALTSGTTSGISSDCTSCSSGARNLVDQLEGAGISWRAYLEDVPRPCFTGASAGGYAKKHNPFIYYRDVAGSPSRCRHLVGFAPLAADLRAGRLPTFVWITPNLCDDGHDCGVGAADRFLRHTVPPLLRELGRHGFLVLTWDEGSSDAGCCGRAAAGGHIATVVAGPDVRPGARVAAPVDHYGVLASIERALGLPPLGAARSPANGGLGALFRSAPRVR